MPFKPMLLRGTKVLARCLEDGSLVAPGGRVEIRYKPTDSKSYAAAVANLVPIAGAPLLPDAGFASATPAPPKAQAAAGCAAAAEQRIARTRARRPPPLRSLHVEDGRGAARPAGEPAVRRHANQAS